MISIAAYIQRLANVIVIVNMKVVLKIVKILRNRIGNEQAGINPPVLYSPNCQCNHQRKMRENSVTKKKTLAITTPMWYNQKKGGASVKTIRNTLSFDEKTAHMLAEKTIELYHKHEEKRKRGQFDKTRQKIMRLLENYGRLCDFVENAIVTDGEQMTERNNAEIISLMGNDKIAVKLDGLIFKTRETRVYLQHLLNAVYVFRDDAAERGDEKAMRQARIIMDLYLAEDTLTVEEVAEMENVSEKTVGRDVREAVDQLAVIWIGVAAFDYIGAQRA